MGSNVAEIDDVITRRRSRFPRYDPNCAVPLLITCMTFDDGRQFKDALIKYLVVERIEKIYQERNILRRNVLMKIVFERSLHPLMLELHHSI